MVPSLSQLPEEDVTEIQDVNDVVSVATSPAPNTAGLEVTTSKQSLLFSSVRPILNLPPVPEIVKPTAPSSTKRPHKERLFPHYKSKTAGSRIKSMIPFRPPLLGYQNLLDSDLLLF